MGEKAKSTENSEERQLAPVEIVLFKSDDCAFCPRAEEVVRETIADFSSESFKMRIIDVKENPEEAEEYGVFALPTIMIDGTSVTGIPEPEMVMKMILGAKVSMRGGTG
ncbi:MAG: thioredoxin family protein [Candidatus Thorarchaeota archaeon]